MSSLMMCCQRTWFLSQTWLQTLVPSQLTGQSMEWSLLVLPRTWALLDWLSPSSEMIWCQDIDLTLLNFRTGNCTPQAKIWCTTHPQLGQCTCVAWPASICSTKAESESLGTKLLRKLHSFTTTLTDQMGFTSTRSKSSTDQEFPFLSEFATIHWWSKSLLKMPLRTTCITWLATIRWKLAERVFTLPCLLKVYKNWSPLWRRGRKRTQNRLSSEWWCHFNHLPLKPKTSNKSAFTLFLQN